MATSFYSDEELQQMGFAHVGHDVMISRKASIYGASNIWIGNHVRVDDFCVLSGKITFGNYIHVAVTTTLFGGTAGITFEDYTGISSHCAVYAAALCRKNVAGGYRPQRLSFAHVSLPVVQAQNGRDRYAVLYNAAH